MNENESEIPALPAQPSYYVFANRATGLIRGWVLTRDVELQEVAATEVVVEVARRPNLLIDKYVDLATGEMRGEA